MKIFADLLAEHKAKGEMQFSGKDAFKLYDTYGFPVDLTEEMVQDEGMTLDRIAFDEEMEAQRVAPGRPADWATWAGPAWSSARKASTVFDGYDKTEITGAKVVAIVAEDQLVDEIVSGMEAIVVLDTTPFYARLGGQVADHGTITAEGMTYNVTDVQKNKGGKFMHYGKLTQGSLKVGDTVTATIDVDRRKAIMRGRTPPPTCWTRSCGPCWVTTSTRALWWSLTVCASTSPTSPP